MAFIKSIKKIFNKYHGFNFNAGLVITGLIFIIALVGCFYTPYEPTAMNVSIRNTAPSLAHIFGCDDSGRDVFSRVMEGIRNTFFISTMTVLIGSGFGIILGAAAGYYGGKFDEILMRINDALFAFPSVLLALVIVSLLGPGFLNVTVALGIAFIPSFARIVRSGFKSQVNMDYVQSARLMGAGDLRIIFVHILPNILPVLMSSVMIGFNNAVLAEAGLSYLGIGVQPPRASLGLMLKDGQALLATAPWNALFPGMVIVLMVLGFALLSEGISEAS
ncbi:MAG: ABC transporter permease [Lachnospiraceae bacterium]|nr:ABC transporter permease [Lachnospiraceae bacterium]